MRQYRLIYDQPTAGPYNMAIDEAIMETVASGESQPTLRLYAWKPACLSLGYGQTWRDVDLERLNRFHWDIVRRPTGGKAILHVDELTYSIALPADHPLAQGGIVESYRRISRALLAAMNYIGLTPQADKRADDTKIDGPVCFEVPSHYEIVTGDGRKLIGSAQLRRRGSVLQHGSIPLYGDVARICEGLSYPTEAGRQAAKVQVRRRAATLTDALGGQVIEWQVAAEALVKGFEETFEAEFIGDVLTSHEQALAAQLSQEVYSSELRIRRI